jgi:hypothetical protein
VAQPASRKQIFEMNLTRVGDTGWLAGDPVSAH